MLMNPLRGNKPVRSGLAAPFLLALLLLTGCGQVFIGFVSNPQPPSSSATGRVDAVVLISVTDFQGNPLTVTAATFFNSGLSSTLHFCGDQRPRLLINDVVRVEFTTETSCLLLVNVVVLS